MVVLHIRVTVRVLNNLFKKEQKQKLKKNHITASLRLAPSMCKYMF